MMETISDNEEDVEKPELAYITGKHNWYNHFGKLIASTEANPVTLFLGMCSKEMNVQVYQKTSSRIFRETLFILSLNWKHPKCPLTIG